MIGEFSSAAWISIAAVLCADVAVLRTKPVNVALAFTQLTFSATVVGAALLSETARGAVAIVLLGVATKVLIQALFWRFAPILRGLAERGARATNPERLYIAASVLVWPIYAFLVQRGGLGWFKVMDLRVDYTAENSVALRVVRHWTPILVFWGLVVTKHQRGEPHASVVTRERFAVGGLLVIQVIAYALLEGSKSAAVVLLFAAAGAGQLIGFRVSRRVAVTAAAAAVSLLLYFLSLVANEWSFSLSDAFVLRMISGSQGLLFAVEPPDGKYCSIETFWFPIENFVSKVFAQAPLSGYTSMGHCLAAADPSYPWELLVPLLAAAYHVSPWAVPLFIIVYVAFAFGLLLAVPRLMDALNLGPLQFPVTYFMAFHLFTVPTHGKVTNFMISEVVSLAAFVAFVFLVKKVLTRAAATDARPPVDVEARG